MNFNPWKVLAVALLFALAVAALILLR